MCLPGWVAIAALTLLAPTPAQTEATLTFRGLITLPADLRVGGHLVGGLSGMTYDAARDVFYAIGDDLETARFHSLTVDLADGRLDPGDVVVTGTVLLRGRDQTPFAPGSVDPEGIALLPDGTLMIATEAAPGSLAPFVRRFARDGRYIQSLATETRRYDPDPDAGRGARRSGGYESLALDPDGATLWAAFETPLRQDAPDYTARNPSLVRVMGYDMRDGQKTHEMVYEVSAATLIPEPPEGWVARGLTDLLPLGQGRFLAVERAFGQGRMAGQATRPVQIFLAEAQGATDIRDVDALRGDERGATKTQILDLDDLRLRHGLRRIGNIETLVFGPVLPDGAQSLLMVEDNDFQRPTQILLFAWHDAAHMD